MGSAPRRRGRAQNSGLGSGDRLAQGPAELPASVGSWVETVGARSMRDTLGREGELFSKDS